MDEMSVALPPDLDTALNEYYAGSRPDPAFAARLEAQLRLRKIDMVSTPQKSRFPFSDKRRSFMQTLRARPVLSVIIAILALLALTGVAYAIGRLTGFIPGFGFTSQDGSVYVLAEPVEVTSGEITLRLEQAVSDGEQFWVELVATGLAEPDDFSRAFVLLPDGEKVQHQIGGSSDSAEGERTLSYLFLPLSGGAEELTLLVEDLGGQDFSVPLKLRPVEAGEIVPISPEGSLPLQSVSHGGVRMVLDHVAVDSSKTVFQISLRYDQPNTWIGGPWNVTLSDETGALYPLNDVTPDTITSGDTHVYQTLPFSGTEQLVFTLVSFPSRDALPLFVDFSADGPSFIFDPGTNPQAGQRWELNQALSAGGFDLKVVRATLTEEPALVFEIEPGPSVTGVMFRSLNPVVTGSTGGVPVHSGNVTSKMILSRIPDQPLEVRLMRINYQVKGPWTIPWQPPAAPTPPSDAPTPTTAPTLVPQATPTLSASNPILLEVQQLAQKFDAPFQQGPGWVHVISETSTDTRPGQDFPLPYLKSEQWYEVDAEGYVIRNVWLDYNDAGQIIQKAATVADFSINFTTGDSGFNRGGRYRFSLNVLPQDLNRAIQNENSHLTREETGCENGRACLLITGWETFPGPIQNPGEAQAFYGAGQQVWIDLESGQQVESQSFWLLKDGSKEVTSTSSYLLVEKVNSPPQEILDVLARVIMP